MVNTQRAITPKVGKPEFRFMCSARRLMVFKVCVKFHENMPSVFKVMGRARKLLTHTQREREREREREKRRKLHNSMAYFVCRGYNNVS